MKKKTSMPKFSKKELVAKLAVREAYMKEVDAAEDRAFDHYMKTGEFLTNVP